MRKKKLHFYKDIGKMNKVIFKIKDLHPEEAIGLKSVALWMSNYRNLTSGKNIDVSKTSYSHVSLFFKSPLDKRNKS